jgi:ferredoxin
MFFYMPGRRREGGVMARLRIDGTEIEVEEGTPLLEAASKAGADIPTLCYDKKIGALTSCMICTVMDNASGRMFTACSATVSEGMDVSTKAPEVIEARREILKMLLGEHVGDCEAPCSKICPAGLNAPRMLRYIERGDMDSAAMTARKALIFPAVLSRVCSAPCERGCRRGEYDKPVSIRALHGAAAEDALAGGRDLDANAQRTGKRIAVIGAGLAGLSVAWVCSNAGHSCVVYEKKSAACSKLRELPEEQLPRAVLDAEIRHVHAEMVLSREVGVDVSVEALALEYDAIVVACGMEFPSAVSVFRAEEDEMFVRSVANGKKAGAEVCAFLNGDKIDHSGKRFNSQIGKLFPEEKSMFARERIKESSVEDLASDAARCLHCECLKPVSCKLRRYADKYGIGRLTTRRMKRPSVDALEQVGEVVFEAGKCVKCGLCVETARTFSDGIGLTFAGRGLTTRVSAPFGAPLSSGLSAEAALACARICPTGALALRNGEDG